VIRLLKLPAAGAEELTDQHVKMDTLILARLLQLTRHLLLSDISTNFAVVVLEEGSPSYSQG
jgi:hypothetical protein